MISIDHSPAMLAVARQRAGDRGREVDLRVGAAQALDFPDASFESVTCTLALCTIPHPATAVAEAARVLRPGGRFLLLEQVRSPVLPVRVGQRMLEPLAVRFQADHLLREPLASITEAGLRLEQFERSKCGLVERPSARKPEG